MQGKLGAPRAAHQVEGLLDGRQHSQGQDVHLQQARVIDVILVPLNDRAPFHPGGLHRDQAPHRRIRYEKAPRVNGEVTGETTELGRQLQQQLDRLAAWVQAGLLQDLLVAEALPAVAVEGGPQVVALLPRKPQGPPRVPQGQAMPVADELADHGCPGGPVALIDVLDDLLPALMLEVHIDVRGLGALPGDEAFEQEADARRVHRGDAQHEADRAVGGAAPALAKDSLGAGGGHDVVHGQEVVGVGQFFDEGQFVGKQLLHLGGDPLGVALEGPLGDQFLQPGLAAAPRRDHLRGVAVGKLARRKGAALSQLAAGPQGPRETGVKRPGLVRRGHAGPRIGQHLALGIFQREPQINGPHEVPEDLSLGDVEPRRMGGHAGQAKASRQGQACLDAVGLAGVEDPDDAVVKAALKGFQEGLGGGLGGQIRVDQQQPRGEARQVGAEQQAFALLGALPAKGDQLAQVAPAVQVLGQQVHRRGVLEADLGPAKKPQARLPGGLPAPNNAVDAIQVAEAKGRVAKLLGALGKLGGLGGTFQEAVAAATEQRQEVRTGLPPNPDRQGGGARLRFRTPTAREGVPFRWSHLKIPCTTGLSSSPVSNTSRAAPLRHSRRR